MRIHFVVNNHREDAIAAAKRAARFLTDRGVEVAADSESADFIGLPALTGDEVSNASLVISFGGDGTLMKAAHLCAERGTPILGVYYGRFGFVTQCHPNELGAALSEFLDGKAKIEHRMMVQTTLWRKDKTIATIHALNEAAVQRAATTRMIDFEISVNNQFVTRYPADGIVISTPTGSTAYNLSAGGPIVDPSLELMMLSAIAPHTLSARSLALNPNAEINIRIATRGDAILSCDGQIRLQMASGDEVVVTKSPQVTKLVTVDDADFLNKVTDRLLRIDQGEKE